MTRAVWTSALLVVCAWPPRERTARRLATTPATCIGRLGHRRVARWRRRRQRAARSACASPPSPGRWSRWPRWSPPFRRGWRRRYPRALCRRGDGARARSSGAVIPGFAIRCGRPKPWRCPATCGLRPSAHGCLVRGSMACSPRWACRRRRPARRCRLWPRGCGRRRRRHSRGSRRCHACCGSPRPCLFRRRREPRWWTACGARRSTARPARSANAASTCSPRPAPRRPQPAARWAWWSPPGRPARPRVPSC